MPHLKLQKAIFLGVILNVFFISTNGYAKKRRANSKRAQDGYKEVVLNKRYPKKNKIELSFPTIGYILNQSYVDSLLFQASVSHYSDEEWGFSLEFLKSQNFDKYERHCIENFYNDFMFKMSGGPPCPNEGEDPAKYLGNGQIQGVNIGPAYVPIREIDTIAMLHGVWTPVYGKMLVIGNNILTFDFYLNMGAGIANYTYYPLQETLKNGKKSRIPSIEYPEDNPPTCPNFDVGVCPTGNYLDYVGINGRPDPIFGKSPAVSVGLGQKFHFGKIFNLKIEFRSYQVVGVEEGLDSYIGLLFGLGIRLL